MTRGVFIALLVAIALPTAANALPIVELDVKLDAATESLRTAADRTGSEIATDWTELSLRVPGLPSSGRDRYVAEVLGEASAGSGGLDLATAGASTWWDGREADLPF